ncbi:MAG: 4-hydroxy-tetrahydrodipicolinate reductase [Bacteroidetes bacterium]|nr:4-hydroxy-tetrahydrodipicolinate reductase [Bacteroidota bacterium]
MKILLSGYGKMGKEIEKIALQRGHQIAFKFDTAEEWNEHRTQLGEIDVVIDFSTPDTVIDNIKNAFSINKPIVVGTTGWNNKLQEIKQICSDTNQTIFHASNFSIGVNIFFEINQRLAELMNDHEEYDITIDEIHHTQKIDSPSGTAITLADQIIKNVKRKSLWVNENTQEDASIGINSQRIDNEPGTHIIQYESEMDVIEIKHTAKNRRGFAIGAIIAAEWVIGKKGFFNMKNLLNL